MEKVEEGGTIAGKGAEGDVRGSFSKYADLTERAIHVQKQIIRKLAEKESCVIIGRSADYILKDSDKINLLRAFIFFQKKNSGILLCKIMALHNVVNSYIIRSIDKCPQKKTATKQLRLLKIRLNPWKNK